MLEAIIMMGGLGVIVGVGLAAASKIFYVFVDPKIVAIDDALPGANCGGCGLPGCSANAEAIVKGQAAPNSCVAAGDEVTEVIATILGVVIEAKEADIARPGCFFRVEDADTKFLYNGIQDCRAAALLKGGVKECSIGCLGLGSCVRACQFNALVMGPEGLPVVNEDRCTGCGSCERVCPKHIITLSSITRRILREYTVEECTTPCQRACPAGIDIREYIRRILVGDYHGSVQVIKERNPFPTVIGRICPRPCELECRREMVEEPVAINALKCFVADFEKKGQERILPYKAPATNRKIAVIGAGVQGLSTAFFSVRLGHEVTVFEAESKPGGLLRKAIAAERLSQDILEYDIDGIQAMGVEIQTEINLGKDIHISSLLEDGFEAVFLATGGWDSRLTRLKGHEIESQIPGVYLLLDFIKADSKRHNKIPVHSDVVISGGKQSLKVAHSCKDLGVDNVSVLLRESREEIGFSPEDLEQAQQENIRILYQTVPNRLFGQADSLNKIESINLQTDQRENIPAQNLLLASGRFPELIFIKSESGWESIEPARSPDFFHQKGIFAQGDPITDYSAAIRAIAAGRKSAAAIHRAMYALPPEPLNLLTSKNILHDVDHVCHVNLQPRTIMHEQQYLDDEERAYAEASRCLQCGLICYEPSEN